MQLPDYIVRQLAKPTGLLGRFILWRLNIANEHMNTVTLKALAIQSDDRVLEIGFGGGNLLDQIVNQAPQSVIGIEISQLAIRKAQARFRHAIVDGVLNLAVIDDDEIPSEPSSFSKVCCVNVIYFWDDPLAMLSEIHRVLQPDGLFVASYQPVGPNERKAPLDLVEGYLRAVGFHKITTVCEWDRVSGEFYCTTASKQ